MIKAIKAQCYLMLNKKKFWLVFYAMLVFVIINYFHYINAYKGWDLISIPTCSELYAFSYYGPYIDQWMAFFPFFIPIVFAFSYYEDRNGQSHLFFMTRTDVKTYYCSKVIACYLGNFFVITVPLCFNLLLLMITFKENGNTMWGQYQTAIYFDNLFKDMTPIEAFYPFASLYIKNTMLYNFFHAIYVGLLSGIFGVFAYTCSFLIKKNKILIFLPVYALFFLSKYLNINISLYIALGRWGDENIYMIAIISLVLVLYSIIAIRRQIQKEHSR